MRGRDVAFGGALLIGRFQHYLERSALAGKLPKASSSL